MKIELEIDAGTCSIRHHAGWSGSAFTREQHPDALYKNGSRVYKMREDEGGDVTPLGTGGTVLGSVKDPSKPYCAYFIEWDDKPRYVTFVIEPKISDLHPVIGACLRT